MIALWAYHWRMGRAVERLFRQAMFERIMGAENMRQSRAHFRHYEKCSPDEMMILGRPS